MNETMRAARGRWREILIRLGVDKKFLSGRNMPCPACGGRDRYRFHNRHKDGDYYCNQCGAGKGISLLMKVHGWDYPKAAHEVDGVIGRRSYTPFYQNDHSQCCKTSEEVRAHRAAQAFFDKQPNFDGPTELAKSLRDTALWLRRFYPLKLPEWLCRHDPFVTAWIERERPLGYWPQDKKFEGSDLMHIRLKQGEVK